MVKLIKSAQGAPYPSACSISPKAIPMARYPMSTGTVTGNAAAHTLRFILIVPPAEISCLPHFAASAAKVKCRVFVFTRRIQQTLL